jgi:hypothetical protein
MILIKAKDKMNTDLKNKDMVTTSGSIFDLLSTYHALYNASLTSNHTSKEKGKSETQSLPLGFSPSPRDVICGRGRLCFNHEGNRFFRQIVDSFVPEYVGTNNKFDKSIIISTIVDCIRSSGGQFVRDRGNGAYYAVSDFVAVSQLEVSMILSFSCHILNFD